MQETIINQAKENQDLEKKLVSEFSKLNETEEKLKKLNEENAKLNNQLQQSAETIETLSADNENLTEINTAYNHTLKEVSNEADKKHTELNEVREKLKQKDIELNKIREELKQKDEELQQKNNLLTRLFSWFKKIYDNKEIKLPEAETKEAQKIEADVNKILNPPEAVTEQNPGFMSNFFAKFRKTSSLAHHQTESQSLANAAPATDTLPSLKPTSQT